MVRFRKCRRQKMNQAVPARHMVDSADLKSAADGTGEPSLTMGESLNALRLSTPQGSLSTPSWGVPPRSDSPPCVCTPPSVPPPPSGAGQTTATDSPPSVCASKKAPLLPCNAVVSESCTKVAQNLLDESKTETRTKSKTELRTKSETESKTKSKTESLTTLVTKSGTETIAKVCDKLTNTSQSRYSMTLSQTYIKIIQANFHQGNPLFGFNAGKQCVANCLSAFSHKQNKPMFKWTSEDLDFILQNGNELYTYLQSSTTLHDDFLLITELPTVLDIGNRTLTFEYSNPMISLIGGDFTPSYSEFNALPMDIALHETFTEMDDAFVCFGGNTLLVGKIQQGYYLFDSHARSDTGMLDPSGTSIGIVYPTLENICDHLRQLAESLGIFAVEQMEITGVKVTRNEICDFAHRNNVTAISCKIVRNKDFEVLESEISKKVSRQGGIEMDLKYDTGAVAHAGTKTYDNEDCVIYSLESSHTHPLPILNGDRKKLCAMLGLKFKSLKTMCTSKVDCCGEEFNVYKTVPDGNCFFRAIAHAVSLSEENHLTVRSKVVKHALDNETLFDSILRRNNESVKQYVNKSRIDQNYTWATEFEIIVTAHLLKCNIYSLTGNTWLKYSGILVDNERSTLEKSILLHHVSNNHYDVIMNSNITDEITNNTSSCKRGLEALCERKNKKKEAKVKDRERKARRQNVNSKGSLKRNDAEYMATYMSEKYKTDAVCRESKKQRSREKYAEDESYRNVKRLKSTLKYQQNKSHRDHLKQMSFQKYRDDESYRSVKRLKSTLKYQQNKSHRDHLKQMSFQKYRDDESYRSVKRLKSTLKYQQNESHRDHLKQMSFQKYRDDESYRSVKRLKSTLKYQQNESHRDHLKQMSFQKYRDDELYRNDRISRSRQKYREDETHRTDVRRRSVKKYQENESHRRNVKERSVTRYRQNGLFRLALKERNKRKYRTNANYRAALKACNLRKYRTDPLLRVRLRKYKRERYKINSNFRRNLISKMIQKYANDPLYRQKLNERYKLDTKYRLEKLTAMKKMYRQKSRASDHFKNKLKQRTRDRRSKILSLITFEDLIKRFRKLSAKGPTSVCLSCKRILFDSQVQEFKENAYKNCKDIVEEHTNTREFSSPKEHYLKQWVCKTCHSKLKQGEIPAEAEINGLKLTPIPEELKNINSLEHHLIALHIPFMKVITLPKGGQNAVQGPVVCVPIDMSKTASLPRKENDGCLLKVKLKRKLIYKGHFEYQCISPKKVFEALQYLKDNNLWYAGIKCNLTLDSQESGSETNCAEEKNVEDDDSNIVENENTENNSGVQYDTCLQPADIGQEVLDHHFDDVYNLAPAEGNNPVKVLQEEGNEAKSFPKHFPDGKSTFNEPRHTRITLARYFNNRLMNADNRFARDTNYIFFAQYVSELKQVIDKTQISLRKSNNSEKNDEKLLKNTTELKRLLRNDEAIRFMQPIRGTPSYWQLAQKDLFAMLRQLGIPTWFCSFSAAEFRWKEIVCAIMEQLDDDRQFEDLDWTEKSRILKSNPVTVARMFDHRYHAFLREVVLSKKGPIGKVTDYFYRVEFQQRGSPHMHCLFWIENAPCLDKDGEQAVCDFVDKYVTCSIPPRTEDLELNETVRSVQQHSKNHSASCRKKGTACRFNFPRPPSVKTFITKESSDDEKEDSEVESKSQSMSKSHAVKLLQMFWNYVSSCTNDLSDITVEDMQRACGMDQESFEEALNLISVKRSLVLKRNINETWTNPYNPTLLKAWDANMDIQFVLDPYSCIVYIISYISKAEREMGMILKQTEIEAREGNMSAKQTLKSIGSTYLHHREVGVQEAVYRVCSLRMKECSRKVVFIPTGENPTRLSKPLSQIKQTSKCDKSESDDESIWMTNIVDRYYYRPKLLEFERMCLAEFSSVFRVLAKSQVPAKPNCNVFQLLCGKGYIQKRTKTDNAIIRYFRASPEKTPEQFYQTILQVYLPHRCFKHLKPTGFDLFQSFYETGYVCLDENSGLSRVKDIVDSNKSRFIKNEVAIDEAVAAVEELGPYEDAWAQICPETELQRLECINLKENDVSDEIPVIPELVEEEPKYSNFAFTSETNTERDQMIPVLQSLNSVQKDIFYHIRDWCIQRVNKEDTAPFHIFVTGGAGTGKSQLIKAIEFEAKRLLLRVSSEPDNQTVLLTAFTGTAAFNIGGCTLHHALKLQRGLPFPYEPLTEQVLSPLRVVHQDLKILVIDEVSMLYKRLLFYIHERLVQIMRKKKPFGGVSVLAVGDFYQLPPVKQKKSERLLSDADACGVDMWNDIFSVIELKQIMRQKNDIPFAEMLHTIRTRTRDQPLPSSVISMLQKCQRQAPDGILHVFCTNDEVNKHNLQMIEKLSSELQELPAHDYKKDKTSGKLTMLAKPRVTSESDSLSSSLLLAKNARVMLTRNVDVSDGLANGVLGTVVDFKFENKTIQAVGIKFDNAKVGMKNGVIQIENRIVYVTRVEEDVRKANIVRYQFPLRLAWACTTHKVQGMTVEAIAVDLKKVFSPGQSYVSLSRVTSQSGLYISDADEKLLDSKVFADGEIKTDLAKMPVFDPLIDLGILGEHIILLNIQSLPNNFDNLASDKRLQNSIAICLTETWVRTTTKRDTLHLSGYKLHNAAREESYKSESLTNLRVAQGGGVSLYVAERSNTTCARLPVPDLEGIILQTDNADIITIYRPQTYPMKHFLQNLTLLLEKMEVNKKRIIVMGDFNEDCSKKEGPLQKLMEGRKYIQHVKNQTTDGWTLIDHVYSKTPFRKELLVIPTYYSYHSAIAIPL